MKKTWIGGIAAVAVVAAGVGAFALTSGQTDPESTTAPTSTATPVPKTSTTPSVTSAATTAPTPGVYPDADEDAFLALVHRDWQGDDVPDDAALVLAGYEACDALPEVDDDRFEEWAGLDNLAIHFAAGAALCPRDE